MLWLSMHPITIKLSKLESIVANLIDNASKMNAKNDGHWTNQSIKYNCSCTKNKQNLW